MIKKITLLISIILVIVSSSYSQNLDYSSDAVLVGQEGNTIVVESSGVSEKRKDAIENGVKSAIHVLLTMGIDGVFNGSPLIPKSKQNESISKNYIDGLLSSDRYNLFVKGYIEQKEKTKNIGKDVKAVVRVSIYHDGLYRDLVKNKIISEKSDKMNMESIEDQLAQMPSIMVVPYRKDGKDYQELLKDRNVRMAITAVDQEFINLGVSTKNYETVLSKIDASNLLNSPKALEDMLLSQSGADVYVTVDLEVDSNSGGIMVMLSMRAAETGTGRNLAAQQVDSKRFNGANIATICSALCKSVMKDFLKQIVNSFGQKVAKGLSLSVEVTMAPGSSIDLNERVGAKGMPIKMLIKQFVRDNAKDGKYETTGETSTRMHIDRVFVTNKIDEFSDNLSMFLYDNSVPHKTTLIDNVLRIVID